MSQINFNPQNNVKRTAPSRRKSSEDKSRIIRILWTVFGIGVMFSILMFLLIYNGIIGYMPLIEELRNPNDKYASVVYSADGQELGHFYQNKGNRVYAEFDEISQHVIDALVATEDVRFMDHSGIDARALARAIVKRGIFRQENAGGGSTITQQLAKQLYSPSSQSTFDRLLQKPIEWVIAIKLERYYTKDEIIKMYLNQFDFLNNAVGIKSAAYVYFGKEPKNLNIQEAATLVGMVKNPSYYNPVRYNERTRDRRNVVFEQMYKADMITDAQLDSLKALPLTLNYHKVDHKDGLAPYFREELRHMMTAKKPVLSDYPSWNKEQYSQDSIQWANNPLYGWVEKNPKPDGSKYNIYTDGLKIYTTLDSRMQQYAEDAVRDHLSNDLQKQFIKEKRYSKNGPYTNNSDELGKTTVKALIDKAIRQSERYRVLKLNGLSASEIQDNFNKKTDMTIFSYKGSIDTTMTPRDSIIYSKFYLRAGFMSMDPVTGYVKAYVGGPDFRFFQYDMVSQGKRQIGSTIKPFLYTYAMEEGYTPCDQLLNAQPTLYDENGRAWQPRNTGSGRIGQMVDLRWALTNSNNWISARLMEKLSPVTLARTMHNFGITSHLDPVIALCLGPCDVSVGEMVSAYTAFANKGMRVAPLFVTRITDNAGNVISEFTPQQTEVISEEAYYKILSILLNVVDSGTGNRLRRAPYNITAQMGGKTGTTNYNADGWFMGFTPQLVSGVWVGGEERYIHFNGMAMGQGASMALPIYGLYMRKVYADKSLPYSQDAKFVFPQDFNPCHKDFYDGTAPTEMPEESIDGIYD